MGGELRILTVRQPWAWAIIHGGKDVENRVRNVSGGYRGPVAIHAAMRTADLTPNQVEFLEQLGDEQISSWLDGEPIAGGVILGVVDLVDVHSASVIGGCGVLRYDCPEHGVCREHCSIWAEGPSPDGWFHHLVLANPRPLTEPIRFRGALGLRRLDDDTAAQIWKAVA